MRPSPSPFHHISNTNSASSISSASRSSLFRVHRGLSVFFIYVLRHGLATQKKLTLPEKRNFRTSTQLSPRPHTRPSNFFICFATKLTDMEGATSTNHPLHDHIVRASPVLTVSVTCVQAIATEREVVPRSVILELYSIGRRVKFDRVCKCFTSIHEQNYFPVVSL